MVKRKMYTGLEHETLVDACPVRHFEISPLSTSVIEYLVPLVLLCRDIMKVRSAEVYQVRLIRALRHRMYKKIVFDRLSPVNHNICNTVSPHIQVPRPSVFKPELPAFAYRQGEMLVRISRFHRLLEDKPVIGIDPYHVICHRPALAHISGGETHIVELPAEIEYRIRNDIVIPEIGLFIQDEPLAEPGTAHRERYMVGFPVIDLMLNLPADRIRGYAGNQPAYIRQGFQSRIYILRDIGVRLRAKAPFRIQYGINYSGIHALVRLFRMD